MYLLTQMLNVLGAGSIYALIALGYSMVYGHIPSKSGTVGFWCQPKIHAQDVCLTRDIRR